MPRKTEERIGTVRPLLTAYEVAAASATGLKVLSIASEESVRALPSTSASSIPSRNTLMIPRSSPASSRSSTCPPPPAPRSPTAGPSPCRTSSGPDRTETEIPVHDRHTPGEHRHDGGPLALTFHPLQSDG